MSSTSCAGCKAWLSAASPSTSTGGERTSFLSVAKWVSSAARRASRGTWADGARATAGWRCVGSGGGGAHTRQGGLLGRQQAWARTKRCRSRTYSSGSNSGAVKASFLNHRDWALAKSSSPGAEAPTALLGPGLSSASASSVVRWAGATALRAPACSPACCIALAEVRAGVTWNLATAAHLRTSGVPPAMAAFVDLLGPQLVAPGSDKIKRFETLKTQDALSGKHVGLLFAASWCAPHWCLSDYRVGRLRTGCCAPGRPH